MNDTEGGALFDLTLYRVEEKCEAICSYTVCTCSSSYASPVGSIDMFNIDATSLLMLD